MMGQENNQQKLFYYNLHLEERVPQNHILRKIKARIDFDFIYREVQDYYGNKGNVSVPPPVILKMMLLLMLYNVRSERELMDTIPLRLDWLWFLGYDLDHEIPNHSVLSKARTRWGVEAFRSFFERIVWQCVEAGLVDGSKLFIDSSLIDANASNNSVVDRPCVTKNITKSYHALEERLEEAAPEKTIPANSRYQSTTDPDAAVTRHGSGRSQLRYKTHRGVDPAHEIITATAVTDGAHDDGKLLEEMIDAHQDHTHQRVATVVADTKYGTIENYLASYDRGIKAHIPSIEESHRGFGRTKDIFPKEAFAYNPDDDTFICPAGNILKKRNYSKERQHYEYMASSRVCAGCQLRADCTRAKAGRSLKRHCRQLALDSMLTIARSRQAQRDLRTRQHLSERSFAQATLYGYKRARWRRLWRMQIQDFLIAAVQNIRIFITHTESGLAKTAHASAAHAKMLSTRVCTSLFSLIQHYFIWNCTTSNERYLMFTGHC
jgi:transposase